MRPLPQPIAGLLDVAMNLGWSWHRGARRLFKRIDPALWSEVRHDPIRLLQQVDSERLEQCAQDPVFVAVLGEVLNDLSGFATNQGTWFEQTYGDVSQELVAYFCAEFAVHHSVPIYSGGLGILAGDHVKSASDIGLPMVAVGLLYSKGYFDQSFDEEGWQVSHDETFDPSVLPLNRLHGADGRGLASVTIGGRTVELGAWEMQVGRTRLLLLDTDLSSNAPEDRDLTSRLYGIGKDLRIKQEWVLGTGGVRVLRALDLSPGCWHANEGHAAFMLVERIRERLQSGSSLDEAVAHVRGRSVFTTHTPVPAGHDAFSSAHIQAHLGPVWETMGIERQAFLDLGYAPSDGHDVFHMTAAAIRLSQRVNGVSAKHGHVSREIWKGLWPDRAVEDVPIGHVTNGVHLGTWMTEPIHTALANALGGDWSHRTGEPELWDQLLSLDDANFWYLHLHLKQHASRVLREQARRRWRAHWDDPMHLAVSGPLLDPNTLTLGFARRFATYKRADLLLRDEERLYSLLTDGRRPIQLVFAGKAHPADDGGKRILQRIHRLACDPRAEGRVAFIEDYEMHLARALFQGVDVWLNVPRVPKEASGTSGMKAALNLAPQFGTTDGWWAEGFTGKNGWAIPPATNPADADESDWEHFFRILEEEIIPLYHDRDDRGVPVGWVERMKHALWVAGRQFTTGRMLQDYVRDYYAPTLRNETSGDAPPTA